MYYLTERTVGETDVAEGKALIRVISGEKEVDAADCGPACPFKKYYA